MPAGAAQHEHPLADRRFWAAALVLVAIALPLRTYHLGEASITHPEIYAPGIDFHDFASRPIERRTASAIVRSGLLDDNHPPGYYLLTLPWTWVAGTSAAALRAPSVLFGMVAIVGVCWLGWRREGPFAAVLAALWLAVHGQHLLWSRSARMWALCAAVAVISAIALQRLRESWSASAAGAYFVATVVGLWSDYTYWPLLAAQIVWVIIASLRQAHPPRELSVQAAAIVAGSPVFVFLLSRLGSSAYLEAPPTDTLGYFLAFDAWFDPEVSATPGSFGRVVLPFLSVVGAMAMAAGTWLGPASPAAHAETRHQPGAPSAWLLAAGVAWPLALAWLWRDQPTDTSYPVWSITIALPLVVATGYAVLQRAWPTLVRLARPWAEQPMVTRLAADGPLLQAAGPFAILLAASTVMPALAPRSTLLLAPFVLIVAARALAQPRPPAWRAAAMTVVAALGAMSVGDMLQASGPDYRALADALQSRSRPDVVYAIEDAWYAQPMHFYLRPGVATLVPVTSVASGAVRPASVWVLGFGDQPLESARHLGAAFSEYAPHEDISLARAGAVRFERREVR